MTETQDNSVHKVRRQPRVAPRALQCVTLNYCLQPRACKAPRWRIGVPDLKDICASVNIWNLTSKDPGLKSWLKFKFWAWSVTKKLCENNGKLHREHIIGCQGVNLSFLKDVAITTVTTATVTTATITTDTITTVTIWVFEFNPQFACLVLSQFDFFSFVTIWFLFSFVAIWIFKFFPFWYFF